MMRRQSIYTGDFQPEVKVNGSSGRNLIASISSRIRAEVSAASRSHSVAAVVACAGLAICVLSSMPLTPDTRYLTTETETVHMARTHRIAVLPGDGIGKETVPESLKVLDAASRKFGFGLELTHYDWSCETYKETGMMMPADGLDQLAKSDSILLGAVGWPGVPDHVSLWGLLIPIRRGFDQYANVRPCKLLPGVRTPLAGRTEADID